MIKNAPSELILSQNDSEPSFFKKIYRLYERAINTIKDQAERLAELLRLDRELREENQRLKDENDLLKADLNKKSFQLNELRNEKLKAMVAEMDSNKEHRKIDAGQTIAEGEAMIDDFFDELFNSSDDTEQEQQQSDEEKPRTFKARRQ